MNDFFDDTKKLIDQFFSNWPAYHSVCTKNRYPEGQNQCDGCKAGIPLENGQHIQRKK